MFRPSTTSTTDSSTTSAVMAPLEPPKIPWGSAVETSQVGKSPMIDSLKSTISRFKSMFNGLRIQRTPKITKTKASGKTTKQQESLRRAIASHPHVDEPLKASASRLIPSEPDTDVRPPVPPHPTLTVHDFELGRALGRGKFGHVYLARHLTTNYICALKIISKAQCASTFEERLIRRELEIHQNLAHKNILKLLSWFYDDTSIYLVLEYAAGGSLYSRLKKHPKGRFDEKTTASFIAQMAMALRYIHSKNIIHRDIEPENILLGLHSEIKLADFGYSVHSESGMRSTVCGTLDYLSPEVALMMLKPGKSEEYYTKAIDQWSLGVLMYELLVGRPPFEKKSGKATQKNIANFNGKGLKFPGYVSQGAEELVNELLNLDAGKRLSLDDVLQHPWVTRNVG